MKRSKLVKVFLFLTLGSALLFGGALFLFIAAGKAIPQPKVSELKDIYEIRNVNVIDVLNLEVLFNHRVQVKAGVITKLQPENGATDRSSSKEAMASHTIDGSGKYLIPGLWDNHSTLMQFSPIIDFPLFISNGVTSIRSNLSCPNETKASLYACMKDKADWQEQISKNQMIGPNIHGWGTFPINGDKRRHPNSPEFHGAGTDENADKVVDHYSHYPERHKPHFLKTYNGLPADSYQKLAKSALQNGFELAGHKPRSVSLVDAVNAGQKSFAHARLFLYECSKLESQIKQNSVKTKPLVDFYRLLIENYKQELCEPIYMLLSEKKVYLNPTLLTRRNDYYAVASMTSQIEGLEYSPYLVRFEWQEDVQKLGTNLTKDEIELFRTFYTLSAQTIVKAQNAGILILAGTDTWNEYIVPGFSLHEELHAMSEAGMDNFAVLQAATINGARYFNLENELGSIDVGKRANMVLLEDNPLDDITHTKTINTVFKGEQIYSQQRLMELKSEVKQLSKGHKITAKLLGLWLSNPSGF